jgi:Cu/Ag efflux protein CusF
MNNSLAAILRKFPLTALAATCTLLLASCAGQKAAEQRYDLKGKVVSVDRAAGRVVIAHEEIPGYMAAMDMPFAV